MKKVIVAIIILTVIIVAGILEAVYIDKTFDTIGKKLDNLSIQIENKDDSALDSIKEFDSWWEQRREKIELFAYAQDLRSFSIAIAETKGSLESGDFENALSKCESLKVMASNIHKLLDFNGEDII